ncbi:MAG: T9SS type A sorting domain-containing protein [Bacteroidales bacterium]|nr:T9SS type A sorting domain-containing protein [Bacteroidales bacterium]MCF8455486.1 T9SS type A sorting domain-containing protein [Bacteroidales bacterium]
MDGHHISRLKSRIGLATLLIIFSVFQLVAQSYCDTVNLEANIPDTVFLCNSDSITISASTGFASYTWSRGDTVSDITLNYSGLYWLTITDDSSCVKVDSVLISLINAEFTHPDTTVCYGDSLSLMAWQDLPNKKSVTFNGTGSSVSFSDADFPIGNAQRSFEAWVYNAGQSAKKCVFSYGESLTGKVFSLSIDQYDSLILQINSTEYYCTETIPQNTWTHLVVGTDPSLKYSFYVNGVSGGTNLITGAFNTEQSGTAWLGRSSDLLAPAWFNGKIDEVRMWGRSIYGTEVNANMYFHTNNQTDIDLLRFFDFNYFFGDESFDMNGYAAQLNGASISSSLPFSNYTYRFLWSSGNSGIADTITYFTNETTNLTISDDVSFCNHSFNITVPPLPDLLDTLLLCNQSPYNLTTGYSYSSYLWNTGNTAPVLSISMGGDYMLTVSEGNCEYTDSIFVSMISIEILTGDTAICPGQSITLQASSSTGNYHWTNDAQTSSVTLTPNSSIVFSVSATDGYNTCSDQVSITVYPAYSIGLPDTVSVCNQGYAIINSSNPYFNSYLWSTGDTTQYNTVTQSGNYQLTATDINGCLVEDASYAQLLQVNILQDDTLICNGTSMVLDVVTNLPNFLWSTGATTNSINITNSGVYSVLLSVGGFGCSDNVTISLSPEIVLNLSDTLASCIATSFLLQSGSPANSYIWNTGAIGPDLMATTTGTYIVTATNQDGCQASDTSVVSIISAYLTISDTLVCEGEEVIVSTNSTQYSYQWSNGSSEALLFEYPTQSTNYSVFVSDAFTSCYYSTSVNVINVLTGPIFGNDSVWSDSIEYYYVNPNPGSSYHWFVSGGSFTTDSLENIEIHWGPYQGYLSVTETTAEGCVGEPVEMYVVIHHPVTIDCILSNDDFVVAPNPMKQSALVTIPESYKNGLIQLFDITGKLLFEDNLSGNSYYLEQPNLAKGVYWIRLVGNESITKKLVVQ